MLISISKNNNINEINKRSEREFDNVAYITAYRVDTYSGNQKFEFKKKN